jgi:signal peptidase
MLKLTRRFLELALFAYVLGVVAVAGATRAAPAAGYGLYAVRSASMTPSIAVGDLVVDQRVRAEEIQPGDVITATVGSATFTHRVVGVAPNGDGPLFSTKGDANPTNDPVATPAGNVHGRVAWRIPLLGYLLAMVTVPSGIIALLAIAATLLAAVWLLDTAELKDEERALARLVRRLEAGTEAP